jgi:hypothetical protein
MDQPEHHHFWVNPDKARYYQVHLGRDLLGDWTLRTVWGGLGSRLGRMHCTGVASYDDGIEQVQAIAKRRAATTAKGGAQGSLSLRRVPGDRRRRLVQGPLRPHARVLAFPHNLGEQRTSQAPSAC